MGGEEKEKQVTVSVTLEIVLTQEDIDDIMCGALEGGMGTKDRKQFRKCSKFMRGGRTINERLARRSDRLAA